MTAISLPAPLRHQRTRKVAYVGRRCDLTEYRFDKHRYGKRVVVRRWLDTGEFELTAIKGDGRTGDFKRFGGRLLSADTKLEDLGRAIQAMAVEAWG